MKKRTRAASRKSGGKRRKPIMRHSREGVRGRKPKRAAKSGRSARPSRSAKPKRKAASRSGTGKGTRSARPAKRKIAAKAKPSKPQRLRRGTTESGLQPFPDRRGMGSESAGQSGDLEALSRLEDDDSESVEELVEEGQAFEAGVISGVEEADEGSREVRTREVPVDDVPQEYLDED